MKCYFLAVCWNIAHSKTPQKTSKLHINLKLKENVSTIPTKIPVQPPTQSSFLNNRDNTQNFY